MKKIQFLIFITLIHLVGCQQKSEVEKCMDALWEHHLVLLDQLIKSGVVEKTALRKEYELALKLEHRFKCLKAHSGKD